MSLLTNDEYYQVKGVAKIFQHPMEKGIASIHKFEVKKNDSLLFNIKQFREPAMFRVREGEYVKLHVAGELMMSDTGMERTSNKEFIRNAKGRVLIAGLGIGLIIHNILHKESVKEIVVVEKYKDVIDLVSPFFTNPKIKIIQADIFNWRPQKGEKFDTIYFDIWPTICTDNLLEIKTLHNNFKFYKSKNGWMDSWMKDYLQKRKRKDRCW